MRYIFGGLWNPEKGIQRSGPSSYANEAGQVVNDDRAMQIAAVFRCIRIISETCASIPMCAYEKQTNGDMVELPNDHWLQRLVETPNSTMTGDEWRESMYAQMAGWGNGYTQVVPNSLGQPVELWPYKVDRMQVKRNEDLTLAYRYPNIYGVPLDLPASRVLHFRSFSLDGVMGLSPLGLARESLGLTVGAERYAASFFGQGGRPSGVMTSDKLLTDKQREQLRKEFGGIAEGGTDKRFWLLEANLKYAPITVSPEDMQMLQTRSFQIADIARFFGVPLFLLMEQEKSTSWGTGIEQQNIGFLTYTLRAYLNRMVKVMNRWIVPEPERGKILVDVDESYLLALDSAAQKELFSSFAQNGIMTRNEIRRRRKLPRMDGADALTAQSNLVPLAMLGRLPTTPATNPAGT